MDIGEQLAAYGLRIGTVEPCLHEMADAIPLVAAVMAELREKKEYELADRLRKAHSHLVSGAHFAFPTRY